MISEHFPTPEELDADDIIASRVRAAALLKEWFPSLDTRPNSVFGDLYVSPSAVYQASLELAAARQSSDLDLARVSRGIISDPAFVEAFLANFGVVSRNAVKASGTIQVVFNTNKAYALDADSVFQFSSGDFRIHPDEGNPVVISPVGTTGSRRVLVRIAENQYTVFLPVQGPSGSAVQNGEVSSHQLPHPEVVSVTAAGDFDIGSSEESLPELADRARVGAVAAHFCSRSGVLSFLSRTWPGLLAYSATITGDREMVRTGSNLLGVIEGAIDIFVRSQPGYTFGESVLPLTWDNDKRMWVGALTLPVSPAFFALKTGVFQVGNFRNNRARNQIYAKSAHPSLDNIGVAFSKYETLGIMVEDFNPQDYVEASISEVTETTSSGAQLKVFGQYSGHVFQEQTSRSIALRMDVVKWDLEGFEGMAVLSARAKDESSGQIETVYFVPNSLSPTFGQIFKDASYQRMFNGLDLELRTFEGTWDAAALRGTRFTFDFRGKNAHFNVHYLYEPLLTAVDATVNASDTRPVQTSIFAKSFLPCHVDQFLVTYRVRFGDAVDLDGARTAIYEYLTGLAHPHAYDESKIGQIMTDHGAAGIANIQKSGVFYPSLANVYVDRNGVETELPRYVTTTLLPPQNDWGVGSRNTAYVLALETIKFNSSIF